MCFREWIQLTEHQWCCTKCNKIRTLITQVSRKEKLDFP